MQFKTGSGWKACYDEEQDKYYGEYGGIMSYNLYELTKEMFDLLSEDMTEGDASVIMYEGRHLYMSVDDRCGPPYTVIFDDDYEKLCPWAQVMKSGKVWPDELTDAAVEIFESEANNREQRRAKRAAKENKSGDEVKQMSDSTEREEQIARIEEYEKIMDEAVELLDSGDRSPFAYYKLRRPVRRLEAYYTGDDWKQDYADDEAGLLPADLKRGVLSQDSIYDLLDEFGEFTDDLMSVKLETERLILRAWTEDDAEACFDYAKDPRVGPAAGWKVHDDVEESRQTIKDILAVPETYAIVLKETGVPIGSIGLHFGTDISKEADEAELGFVLSPDYWGRGLVPEASEELLRHAFCDLGLNRVWCAYYEGNKKSRRTQEKIGFKFKYINENVFNEQLGETKNSYVSCLTREEWEER